MTATLDYRDALLLEWMRAFTEHEGRVPTAGEIAQVRSWHRSSAVNWAGRMVKAGYLMEDWTVRDARV